MHALYFRASLLLNRINLMLKSRKTKNPIMAHHPDEFLLVTEQKAWTVSCRNESWLSLPHGIQQGAILCDTQEFIRHGHVVGHRLLSIVEKCIWSPDFTCHEVV